MTEYKAKQGEYVQCLSYVTHECKHSRMKREIDRKRYQNVLNRYFHSSINMYVHIYYTLCVCIIYILYRQFACSVCV